MTPVVIAVVAVAWIAFRVWRRRRGQDHRASAGDGAPDGAPDRARARALPLGAAVVARLGDIGLVAEREVRERVRGRIFRVGTLLILAAVAAAIVIPAANRGSTHLQKVGTVGAVPASLRTAVSAAAATSVGTTLELLPEADQAAARRDLRSGRIDPALVDGRQLVVNRAFGADDTSDTAQLARALARSLGVNQAFEAAGLSAVQADQVAGAKPIPVTSLEPAPPPAHARGTSVVGLILVFLMLTQYNTWVLIGVMEEKSSRVVEVLLAAVRPVQLLAGKVLGIGLVAFAQAGLIVAFALGLGAAVGSDLVKGTAPAEVVSALVWLVLGYAFYSWVYAAAGSMAERQDQVQSLAFPLSVPIIFGYIVTLSAAGSGTASTLVKVLAYVPLTAMFAMPLLVGLGQATWWQFAASAAVSIASTYALARLAAGIYRRAILRTGRRVRLRELLSRSGA